MLMRVLVKSTYIEIRACPLLTPLTVLLYHTVLRLTASLHTLITFARQLNSLLYIYIFFERRRPFPIRVQR